MLRRGRLRLWSIEDVETGDGHALRVPGELRTIVAWSRAFLNAENADLGRDGPVCPFTRSAMERNRFYVTTVPALPVGGIVRAVERYRTWYGDLVRNAEEGERLFITILIALPGMDLSDARSIDELQCSLKPQFVRDGLMIGQFHPACDQPGIWNADFRPLRSPIPLLAIRAMVRHDLPFLMEQPMYLDAYLARFAPEIPPVLRAHLAEAAGRRHVAAALTGTP